MQQWKLNLACKCQNKTIYSTQWSSSSGSSGGSSSSVSPGGSTCRCRLKCSNLHELIKTAQKQQLILQLFEWEAEIPAVPCGLQKVAFDLSTLSAFLTLESFQCPQLFVFWNKQYQNSGWIKCSEISEWSKQKSHNHSRNCGGEKNTSKEKLGN